MQRHVEFERLHNFRDLGGYRSADGRTVRWGTLYRADSLGKLVGGDRERFLKLGIRTVIDLRYPWEIEAKGRVPEADRFRYVNLSIEHRPYDQAEIDPDIDPWRYLADRFAEVTEDGADEIRQVLEELAQAPGPAVFHCTSGQGPDRADRSIRTDPARGGTGRRPRRLRAHRTGHRTARGRLARRPP
ncbi:tyrosine-protein phosphatase [Streptomyces sp. TE12347]